MTCPRHKPNTDLYSQNTDDAPDTNDSAKNGANGSWKILCGRVPALMWLRGLRCAACRRERRAEQMLARGVAQIQADTLPDAALNRMLDALGLPPVPHLGSLERARLKADLRGLLLLVGLILFMTTLAQPELIGQISVADRWFGSVTPNALQSARLWLFAALFWYLKPLFALLAARFARSPRMRSAWITVSALGAAGLWLLLPVAPNAFWRGTLLVGIGAMLAPASVLMGGLLVEQGQRMGATGRLGALHAAAIFLARLASAAIVGMMPAFAPVGVEWLVAVLLVAFAVVYWTLSRRRQGEAVPLISAATESANALADRGSPKGTATTQTSATTPLAISTYANAPAFAVAAAGTMADIRALFRSKNVWGAAGIAFFLYVAPNFTSLQAQENLRLGFSPGVQSGLDFVGAACGLAGVGGYLILCRRLTLQTLLRAGIVCNALGTLLYLGYRSTPLAFLIEGANGLLSALVFAMLFDLAIRAIPRRQAMLGYAFLTGVFAFASHLSNVFGSWLNVVAGWHFAQVVWMSAALSAPALLLTALLPAALLDRREGKIHPVETVGERSGAGIPLWGH